VKITYRIPSKKVPYGYVEMVDENAAMPQPDELAEFYAKFIIEYQKAEVRAFEAPAKPKADPNDDINVAAQTIKDGLGATELSPEEAAKPWTKTDQPTTKKDWEEPAPAVAEDDSIWDFD
jgi:hypothetical protein